MSDAQVSSSPAQAAGGGELPLGRGHEELGHRLADGLRARIAEGPLGGGVELDDPPAVIGGDIAVERRLQRRQPQPLGLLARRFGELAVGDLAPDALDLEQPASASKMPVSVQCSQCTSPSGWRAAPSATLVGFSGVMRAMLRVERLVLRQDQITIAQPLGAHLLQRTADVSLRRLVHEGPEAVRPDPHDELGLRVHHRAIARLARRQRPRLRPRLGHVALDRHEVREAPLSSRRARSASPARSGGRRGDG